MAHIPTSQTAIHSTYHITPIVWTNGHGPLCSKRTQTQDHPCFQGKVPTHCAFQVVVVTHFASLDAFLAHFHTHSAAFGNAWVNLRKPMFDRGFIEATRYLQLAEACSLQRLATGALLKTHRLCVGSAPRINIPCSSWSARLAARSLLQLV